MLYVLTKEFLSKELGTMVKPIDLSTFLDHTFFAIDTYFLLADIEDFIDLSERNIDTEKNRELHEAESQWEKSLLGERRDATEDYVNTVKSIDYRFDVSLTQRVRYAALVSLITTIEWVLLPLKKRFNIEFPKQKPAGISEAVHILHMFNRAGSLCLESKIRSIETLVHVRNCIVHAAGLVASYKHDKDLRKRLVGCHGIKISDINHLGEAIEIEPGYLQGFLEDLKCWLPSLERDMREKGLLHDSSLPSPAPPR